MDRKLARLQAISGSSSPPSSACTCSRCSPRRSGPAATMRCRRLPAAVRWHRWSAYFLLVVIVGHIAATRGIAVVGDVDVGFGAVAFAMGWMPTFFAIYYTLLALEGLYPSVVHCKCHDPALGTRKRLGFAAAERHATDRAGLGHGIIGLPVGVTSDDCERARDSIERADSAPLGITRIDRPQLVGRAVPCCHGGPVDITVGVDSDRLRAIPDRREYSLAGAIGADAPDAARTFDGGRRADPLDGGRMGSA